VSLYYYVRIVAAMFMRKEFLPAPLSLSVGVFVALALTAALTVVIGIWPAPFLDIARFASFPLV